MLETIAKAGSKLTSVSNTVLTVRNVLIGLGLTEEEACDPKQIVGAITRIAKKWYSDVANAFDYLISKNGLNLIMGAAILALAIIGGAALSWASLLVGEFVFGNLIGSVFALIAALLLLLPGIELLLQYLLVKTLKEFLRQRRNLCQLLSNDIQTIITILQEYRSMTSGWKQQIYYEIRRAISESLRAERLLGTEVGRIENNNRAVRVGRVWQADQHIHRAISYLNRDLLVPAAKEFATIYKQYNLTTAIPNARSPMSEWLAFFTSLNIELTQKYFTYKSAEGTDERKKEEAQKRKTYTQIMVSISRRMPNIIQVAMMKSAISVSTKRLIEKFPIIGANSALLFSIKKAFNKEAYGITAQTLQTSFGMPITEDTLGSLFQKSNLKDANLQELTTRVRTYEALILLFPTMWKSIESVGKLYLTILKLAMSQVKEVREDMQDAVTNQINVTLKKFKWISKLQQASQTLSPIIGIKGTLKIGTPHSHVSPAEIAEMMDESFPILEKLKAFIVKKSYNTETQKRKREPIEVADELAQRTILPLIIGIDLELSSQNIGTLIAQLQSLKVLLNLQKKMDSIELGIGSSYIESIESSPAFPQMIALYDYLLKVLEDSPVNDLVSSLATGNISSLVAFYEGISDAEDMLSIITCQKDKDAPAWYMDKLSPDLGLNTTFPSGIKALDSLQRETTKVLSQLQDGKRMIEEQLDAAIQKLSEMQLTDDTETYDAKFEYET